MQEQEGMPVVEQGPRDNVVTGPGQDIFKKRVRVMFEFDCSVNIEPILSTANDNDVKAHDLALLEQFLQTDKALELMVDKIGATLGLNCPESFVETFLGQIDTDCHSLFSEAIDALSGDNREYWSDIRDAPMPNEGDLLSLCTEEVIECFEATFVKSSYEVVEDKPEVVVVHNYIDQAAIDAASHLRLKKGESNA